VFPYERGTPVPLIGHVLREIAEWRRDFAQSQTIAEWRDEREGRGLPDSCFEERFLVLRQHKEYRSFPRALADMLSARKVISLITGVIRSQPI